MRKPVVVIGLGNPLMSDEGIGPCLVQRLAPNKSGAGDKHPLVEFIDAGVGGVSILHLIEGRQKAIFIDCARMGEQPGTIKRFTLDEVKTQKVVTGRSLHEADLLRIIEMASRLRQCPQRVAIFGIEPEKVGPGLELSQTLAQKVDSYIAAVSQELPE